MLHKKRGKHSKSQFRFQNDLDKQEVLFAIQVLVQRCRNVNCDIFHFLDYENSFSRRQYNEVIKALNDVNVDEKDIKIITNLFWG